jgi:hypothetical protein
VFPRDSTQSECCHFDFGFDTLSFPGDFQPIHWLCAPITSCLVEAPLRVVTTTTPPPKARAVAPYTIETLSSKKPSGLFLKIGFYGSTQT